MESMKDSTRRVVGGVDTHKDLHVAAVVDGLLDWQFETLAGGRCWTRSMEGTVLVLEIDDDGRSVMTKSVKGGKAKRQTDGCKDNLTEAGISRLLGAA